ncbi:MAG: hypothetical protein GAK28_00873 [Luteibacter sp.]|uniref:DUF6229 family protein n=1 Tax=Luteibacter sp. TaxID=1886636 RepID=UPI00137E56D1|nr:DUF6229 family protein [Luteibacter sp.]KAF1008452.1 MAG: hypothetical protein GAK28_00873 [Luteibacter sp.]
MIVESMRASQSSARAAFWRSNASAESPAGALFASEFAEADIVGGTDIVVTDCLMCTGSIDTRTRHIQCGA